MVSGDGGTHSVDMRLFNSFSSAQYVHNLFIYSKKRIKSI